MGSHPCVKGIIPTFFDATSSRRRRLAPDAGERRHSPRRTEVRQAEEILDGAQHGVVVDAPPNDDMALDRSPCNERLDAPAAADRRRAFVEEDEHRGARDLEE